MIDEAAIVRLRTLRDVPVLAEVLAFLNGEGEETRLVGGAVRNALLGTPVEDIDLGTTMLPEAVTRCAEAAGWQVVPTGIEHGTVTLVKAGDHFEVTTLRQDIDSDGRRAVVRFGRDFAEDAARRDFTINALSMGSDGKIHDYFGGLADLAVRKVRFIGDAGQRLQEDYLRGLRFLRFSAAYGDGKLDAAGFAAVLAHRAGFAQLSRERIRQETLKLLVAGGALPVIEAAEAEGVLSEILGFPLDVRVFARAMELARQSNVGLDAMARLAALAGAHAGDEIALWQARLRLSNAEITALHRFGRAIRMGEASARLLAYRFGNQAILALILRVACDVDLADGLSLRLAEARAPVPEFLITGADLLAAGIPSGPQVGRLLRIIEQKWIEMGFPADQEAQAAVLQSVISLKD